MILPFFRLWRANYTTVRRIFVKSVLHKTSNNCESQEYQFSYNHALITAVNSVFTLISILLDRFSYNLMQNIFTSCHWINASLCNDSSVTALFCFRPLLHSPLVLYIFQPSWKKLCTVSTLTIWSGSQFRENQPCESRTVLQGLNEFVFLLSTIIIVRFGCNSVQNTRSERCWAFELHEKMCDISLVWMDLHWRVYRETILRFGSKEHFRNVYFEHIVALHVGVCTQRCKGGHFQLTWNSLMSAVSKALFDRALKLFCCTWKRWSWERKRKFWSCLTFVRKPKGQKPLTKRRLWWEDIIKLNLKEIRRVVVTSFIWPTEWGGGGAVVKTVMKLWVS
jgi:hypothetical protein